jgi:thiol-disulfide isomerase/thioredoxin
MKQNPWRLAMIFAAVLLPAVAGFAGMGYLLQQRWQQMPQSAGSEPLGVRDSTVTKLIRLRQPRELPQLAFTGADGAEKTLADWRGKVVLVNLWATWCVPCRAELPSLDRLQAKLGGDDFAVVAISVDRSGPDAPKKYLTSNGLTHLQFFIDAKGDSSSKLTAQGLPTSLIIGRDGREIARLAGAAEWDGPALTRIIEAEIAAR